MICSKCGKNSTDSAKFCEYCGTPLTEAIYSVSGAYGRHLYVYPDKCVITINFTNAPIIGNYNGSEKTIYYVDCNGVQFRKHSGFLGYIQLETASGLLRGIAANSLSENSFPFDKSKVSNEQMEEIYLYIKRKVEELKGNKKPVISSADEIKKYKELLDNGAITQEEFDALKKKLLDLP